ncbi:MAG: pyridoxamine 5'-phosphate oxidase family protein [Acidimicrobiia bacterium]
MSIRLSPDEAWAEIENAHTASLTTLRSDGWPVTLPVWFVVIDRAVYVRTPAQTKKVARVRHDERACFTVERGEKWAELCAVAMQCTASIVDDEAVKQQVSTLLDKKYSAFRMSGDVPAATRQHYANNAFIKLEPHGRLLTWDNARIGS